MSSLSLYTLLAVTLTMAWQAAKLYLGPRRPISPREAVLITGATSGIGLAVTKHLLRAGYSVFVGFYDAREAGHAELKQLAQERAKQMSVSGQKMIFIELDVRSEASIARAYGECSRALEEHSLELHALINNAGLGSLQPFAWLQRRTIRALVETNLLGTLLMTREFLPLLARAKSPRILNVASGLGFTPGPTYAVYGLTKAAQVFFTNALNTESQQVRSVAIVPHNFIKNTNITAANVKQNELGWEELKPLERELYAREYKEHVALAKALEHSTKTHAGKTRTSSKQGNENLLTQLKAHLRGIKQALVGENAAPNLEQSGVLESFELALTLTSPPAHMFAGDKFFQLLVGSLLLALPASYGNLMSPLVKQSLYK